MSFYRATSEPPNSRSPWEWTRTSAFSVTELLVVIGVLAFLVIFVSPWPRSTKDHALRTTCARQLAEIGVGFKAWTLEGTNEYPMRVPAARGGTREPAEMGLGFPQFQVLSNQVRTPAIFTCPADQRIPSKAFASFSNTNLSYFVGLDAEAQNPRMFLAGDRSVTNSAPFRPRGILLLATNTLFGWNHEMHNCQGNVLLVDGSVQEVGSFRLRDLNAQGGGTDRPIIP